MARHSSALSLLRRVDGAHAVDLIHDVITSLQNKLNCKRDYASFLPDFGLSISDVMWSARPMQELARHIRLQILAYEPRLRDPKIEPDSVDDHMCPTFRIYGDIGHSSVRLILSLHTVNCHIEVVEES